MNIWIDIENIPHVPFFKPIIDELKKREHNVVVTLRDCQGSKALADEYDLEYELLGEQSKFKIRSLKIASVLFRSLRLILWARDKNINKSVSHGSRSLVLASKFLKIQSLIFLDYENADLSHLTSPTTTFCIPDGIPISIFQEKTQGSKSISQYPGFKEVIYAERSQDLSDIRKEFSIDEKKIVAVIRPSASRAHYHNNRSEEIFFEILNYFVEQKDAIAIVIPRYPEQKAKIKRLYSQYNSIIIPAHPIKNPKLLGIADMVLSGGGTMVREAAAVGIPAYTFFTGELGALDLSMIKDNLITQLSSVADICKIKLQKYTDGKIIESSKTLGVIIDKILSN